MSRKSSKSDLDVFFTFGISARLGDRRKDGKDDFLPSRFDSGEFSGGDEIDDSLV